VYLPLQVPEDDIPMLNVYLGFVRQTLLIQVGHLKPILPLELPAGEKIE
jgi:hypothetical protein